MNVVTRPDATTEATHQRPLMLVVGTHAVVDMLMFSRAWVFESTTMHVMLAILFAQCSLVAIWAALASSPRWTRFLFSPLAVMVILILIAKLLSWGQGTAAPMEWMLTILVQTLSIVIVLSIARRGWSFNLQALSYTIVVAAMAFAFIRGAQTYWQWSTEYLSFAAMAVHVSAGLCSAIVACASVFAIVRQDGPVVQSIVTNRSARSLVAILVVLVVVLVFYVIVAGIYGNQAFSIVSSLILFGTQSVCVCLTLVSFRRLQSRIG